MSPDDRCHPRASLTHPLFLAGLLLLVLNDHVLKGSGLAPAALTGKLSDVAGLLVAPLVLAWLFGVRDRRGWRAVHVAVAVGFAALQVPPVASAIEDGLRLLGLGARLWADPTDLLALPALALSHRFLGRRRARPSRLATVSGVAALVFCTATPGPGGDPPPRYPFPPAGLLETDVFVRHTGSEDLEVSVRRLRDETSVDCEELLDPPREMLEDGDFGDERRWRLARGDAVPLWDRRGGAVDRECYAVRFKVRDREWLVTWRHGAPALREIDIRLDADEEAEPDAVQVAGDPETAPRVPAGVTVRRR